MSGSWINMCSPLLEFRDAAYMVLYDGELELPSVFVLYMTVVISKWQIPSRHRY